MVLTHWRASGKTAEDHRGYASTASEFTGHAADCCPATAAKNLNLEDLKRHAKGQQPDLFDA